MLEIFHLEWPQSHESYLVALSINGRSGNDPCPLKDDANYGKVKVVLGAVENPERERRGR